MVKDDDYLKIYVNGILDAAQPVKGATSINEDPLFIGTVPWLKDGECSVPLLMDEIRMYNKVIYESEIEAEASPALGGIAPNFV